MEWAGARSPKSGARPLPTEPHPPAPPLGASDRAPRACGWRAVLTETSRPLPPRLRRRRLHLQRLRVRRALPLWLRPALRGRACLCAAAGRRVAFRRWGNSRCCTAYSTECPTALPVRGPSQDSRPNHPSHPSPSHHHSSAQAQLRLSSSAQLTIASPNPTHSHATATPTQHTTQQSRAEQSRAEQSRAEQRGGVAYKSQHIWVLDLSNARRRTNVAALNAGLIRCGRVKRDRLVLIRVVRVLMRRPLGVRRLPPVPVRLHTATATATATAH